MDKSFDIRSLYELRKADLEEVNPQALSVFYDCLQSFELRNQYCLVHYDYLAEILDKKLHHRSLWDCNYAHDADRVPAVPVHFQVEANVLAFMHNLHAMVDTIPLIIELVFAEPDTINLDHSPSWGQRYKKFEAGKKYLDSDVLNQFLQFRNSECFQTVKAYVNTAKHSHIMRVTRDKTKTLQISGFRDIRGKEEPPKDLSELITNSYNYLRGEAIRLLCLLEPIKLKH